MVREENVKLMSRIAMYENGKGKKELPINRYYKDDYVRLNALKAVAAATITFTLIAMLVIVYKLDYILTNVLKLDYKAVGIKILAIYGVWILIYWLLARIIYTRRYENIRSNIIIYNHNLKKLQEEAGKEVVKAKGGVGISDDFIDF